MQTLSNGYKKPQSGDTGSTLWTALEFNIQRLNDHTHDGVDSERLPAQNFQTTTDDIEAANWVAVAGQPGHYKQTMTVPAGFTFDDFIMSFRDSEGLIYPTVVRLTNTTYDVYTIDNTQDFTVVYGV